MAPYLSPSTEKVDPPVLLNPFVYLALGLVVGHLALSLLSF